MHRQPLLDLLERYREAWPEEESMRRRIVQFVNRYEDCFERTQLRGHITGSAWILDKAGKRTLLTHHRKLNRWLQPGGHADGDADVMAVALREAEEESGITGLVVEHEIFDVDVHLIPARGDEPEHYHYDCRFIVHCTDSEDYVVSDESHDLAWVPLDTIGDYTDEESVLRMVAKTP